MQRVGGLVYLTTQFRRRRAILNGILPLFLPLCVSCVMRVHASPCSQQCCKDASCLPLTFLAVC